MMTTWTYNCKFLIPCIPFSGVHSSLVLGYSLWDNRKIITTRQISFRSDVFIVFAVVIAKALYCQAMRVHGDVLKLVTPDCFILVTCHCTPRYKQKNEIKTKLLGSYFVLCTCCGPLRHQLSLPLLFAACSWRFWILPWRAYRFAALTETMHLHQWNTRKENQESFKAWWSISTGKI